MIWGSIIGICRYHDLLVAHEVNVKGNVNSKFQNVEDEDIGSVHRTGEAANVGVVHLPKVAVELVKHNRLVKVAGGEVGGARGSEGHSQWLGKLIKVHGE